jgi:hypothetical protein
MFRSLLLAGAFLLGSCSLFAVDQGLLDLVPAGTRMISGVQAEKIKTSLLGQYVMAHMQQENENLQHFIQSTGFDPRRDVQELLFVSNGDPQQPQMAVIARGYFDPARIKSAALAAGGSVEPSAGVDLIAGKGKKEGGIAFLDNTLAIAGNKGLLKTIVSSRKIPASLDPQLQTGLRRVSAEGDAWFVSLVPGSQLSADSTNVTVHGQQFNGALIQSVLQSSGWIRFGDTIQVNLQAVTRSEKDAQSLADVVRFLSSMVQTQKENQPQAAALAQALNAMQLRTDGNTMEMSLDLPEKAAEQLMHPGPRVRPAAAHLH